ncbi:uncharacterized protein LOC132044321 [Lycium ferocissimum]|uniref:uncharacterized protein LOC132044321 n=1 Tax=Lycium ferocissimum TaxID=112874 RepID=UPI002815A341|nr:uncharacterized protein LOC132044321 [Lycium ferocissimum]XP_059290805.1 uncharacterized protein LOC132044321 [Lycium ferocissimum]
MDFTSRGIAWMGKIGEKLENLCSDVDARSQEPLDFVESQLQIAGANLKQFCSEFIQEILPAPLSDAEEETSNLSSEQNREDQHPASELSNISVEEDNKDELSHSNSSSAMLAVETTEGVHVESSLQPRADKAMKMSVEDNFEKALSFVESSGVVASTEGTLKMTSLYCEGDKGVEGPAKSSTIASAECVEFDPSMQEGRTIDFGANTSNVSSLTGSTYSNESQESAFPDFGETNSCAALPSVTSEASVDHHVRQPATDWVPEVEFDGSCVVVDKDDLSSASEFRGAHISPKKVMPKLKVKPGKKRNKDATICEDLSVELEQSNAKCMTISSPDQSLELSQEGFCESDWEII